MRISDRNWKTVATNFERMNLGTITMATKTTIPIPEKFETLSEAKHRRAYKIRILRKGKKPARKLATKMDQCSKGQPCESAACDVCVGRELRIPTKSPGYNGMMSPGIPE
jgi:hypothetical protein